MSALDALHQAIPKEHGFLFQRVAHWSYINHRSRKVESESKQESSRVGEHELDVSFKDVVGSSYVVSQLVRNQELSFAALVNDILVIQVDQLQLVDMLLLKYHVQQFLYLHSIFILVVSLSLAF